MTESELRQSYVETAQSYLGANEGSAKHHEIVDIYNTLDPLPRGYPLKYTDDWCAGYVSAMAQICGLTDIILPECSCPKMIEKYQAVNGWEENDAYQPQPGDLIMYDWDNLQYDADHVGIVVSCNGSTIKVIEGNKSNTVEYRELAVDGNYIRGFCLPDYASKATGSSEVSNSKFIWDYFLTKLGNPYGVAGLMGNLEAESGLHPDRVQGDIPYSSYSQTYTAKVDNGTISEYDFVHNGPGGGGYGLAQWTYYTRKQGLYNMWQSGGYYSIGSISLACDYLWYELQNSYRGVLTVLRNAGSIREASDKVLHDFENPADQSESVEAKRASMGQAWYDLYINSDPGEPDEPEPDPDDPNAPPWTPSTKRRASIMLLICATRRQM